LYSQSYYHCLFFLVRVAHFLRLLYYIMLIFICQYFF